MQLVVCAERVRRQQVNWGERERAPTLVASTRHFLCMLMLYIVHHDIRL